jgi:hypothetical protein
MATRSRGVATQIHPLAASTAIFYFRNSQPLLTPFSGCSTAKIFWKKQTKNNPQKLFFEFLHHFLQIPGRSRHESIDLNANSFGKAILLFSI